jgi:hypothetical protein
MSTTVSDPAPPSHAQLHDRFLELLPRLERHGRIFFRGLKAHQKEEAIADMVALAWKWFGRLAERGKDVGQFPTAFVSWVARAVNQGRRLTGQESAKEVLNPEAQRRHSFRVLSLPTSPRSSIPRLDAEPHGRCMPEALEERLRDNTRTPVPEQAAFRIDWPAWLTTIAERDRRLLEDLALSHRTGELARKYGLSPGRISQKRRQFHDDWQRFCGEAPAGTTVA